MNPDLPHQSPEELEASLTALLLGELAPEQAAGLRRAIEQDAALAALHQRLKLTIDLVREAAAHPTEQAEVQRAPLKLSERRRQELLAHFKTVTPREFARRRRHEWASRALVGMAAVVVGMAALALLVPNFVKARSQSRAKLRASGASFRAQLSDREAAAVAGFLAAAGGQPASARSQAKGKEGLERYAYSGRVPGVSAGSSKEGLPAPAGAASGAAGGKPGPPALATRTEIVLPATAETTYAAKESLGKEATESSREWLSAQREIAAADRKEAANLANAVAEAYRDYRLEERASLSKGGIKALLEARDLKEAEIVEAQTNVDRLRRELNISDSMASEYAAAPLLSAETLRHINGLRLESEANFVQQETLLNHLKTLKPEVLRQTLPTALQDNLLGTLLDQKTYADQRLLSVEKDYGALHPDVIKARALVADLEDKIDQRVKGVMVGLGARVDALGQSLTNLNRKVEEATSNDIVKANQSAPYFAAKRRLEELTRFRTLLDTKIASEKASEPAQPTVPQARLEASDVAAGKPGPAAVGTRTEIVLPAAGETKYAANESLGKEAFESSLGWLSTQREIAAADRKDAAGEETAAFGFRLGGRQAEEARPELGAVRPGALGLAGAPASRESVGVHELANADPQEVQRVLSDLFSRGGFSQDGRRRALLGQANPLTQRSTQQTAGLPPGTTAGPGQFPAAATIGDAYFTTDPESRRVVTIADEATARAIGEALAKSDTTASGVFGGGMMGGMGGGMRGGIPTVPKASEPAQPTLPQARLEASGSAVVNSLGTVVNSFGTALPVAGNRGTTTPAETTGKPTAGTQVARLTAEEAIARGIPVLGDVPLLGQTLERGGSARPSAVPVDALRNSGSVKGLPAQEQAAKGAATTPQAGQDTHVYSLDVVGSVNLSKQKLEGHLVPNAADILSATPSLPAERYGEKELQSKEKSGVSTEPAKAGRVDIALPSPQSEARPAQAESAGKDSSVLTAGVAVAVPSAAATVPAPQGVAASSAKYPSLLGVPAPEGVAAASSQQGAAAVQEKAKASEQQIRFAQAPKLVEENKALKERAIESREKLVEAEKAGNAAAFARRYALRAPGGAAPAPQAKAESDEALKREPAAPAAIPQPEVEARENAFSTFSLNVSDVSFKLAAASLAKGQMPEPATVRSEEFINAFDYRDPEAPPGVPVAFAWERARYPFAHNRDLLRFSLRTAAQGRQPGRALNLVLLLDNSGSMERADRVRIIHEALRVMAAQLQPADVLSVVTFARTARLWVDGVPGDRAAQVAEEVSGLTPQGGTNLEEAMNLAY